MDDLIALVGAVDALLTAQSGADAEYFMKHAGRRFDDEQQERIGKLVLEAYRWQYIVSGVRDPRFLEILADLTTEAQRERIGSALSPLM